MVIQGVKLTMRLEGKLWANWGSMCRNPKAQTDRCPIWRAGLVGSLCWEREGRWKRAQRTYSKAVLTVLSDPRLLP